MNASIIMPVYNAAPYLAEALNSCLKQDYPTFEIVLVDDGSTDSTPDLIAWYTKKYSQIRAFHQPNGGPASAMNYGIERAVGDFVCFAAGDDIQLPNKLFLLAAGLEGADFCYSSYIHANIDGKPWQEVKPMPLTKKTIKDNTCCSGGAIAVKRSIPVRFREELRVNEDMAYFWDLLKGGYSYTIVPEPTFLYRLNRTSMSYARKKEVEKITELIRKEIDETKTQTLVY